MTNTKYKFYTPEQKLLSQRLRQTAKEIKTNPGLARKVLMMTGCYDKQGNLLPECRGEYK